MRVARDVVRCWVFSAWPSTGWAVPISRLLTGLFNMRKFVMGVQATLLKETLHCPFTIVYSSQLWE